MSEERAHARVRDVPDESLSAAYARRRNRPVAPQYQDQAATRPSQPPARQAREPRSRDRSQELPGPPRDPLLRTCRRTSPKPQDSSLYEPQATAKKSKRLVPLRRTLRKNPGRYCESAAPTLAHEQPGLDPRRLLPEQAALKQAPQLESTPCGLATETPPTTASSGSRAFSCASLPASTEEAPSFASLDEQLLHFYGSPPRAEEPRRMRVSTISDVSVQCMRVNFVDWATLVFSNMIECFGDNSFFRCVHIFDRFFAANLEALAAAPQQWPAIWASCFVLACKFEEYWDFKPLEIEKTFGVDPVGPVEWQVVQGLDFCLAGPTADDWIGWHLQKLFHRREALFGADGREKAVLRYCCALLCKKLLLCNELALEELPQDLAIVCLFICIEQLPAVYALAGLQLTQQKQLQLAAGFEALAKQGLTHADNMRLKDLLTRAKLFLETGYPRLEPHLAFKGLGSLLPFEEYFARLFRRKSKPQLCQTDR